MSEYCIHLIPREYPLLFHVIPLAVLYWSGSCPVLLHHMLFGQRSNFNTLNLLNSISVSLILQYVYILFYRIFFFFCANLDFRPSCFLFSSNLLICSSGETWLWPDIARRFSFRSSRQEIFMSRMSKQWVLACTLALAFVCLFLFTQEVVPHLCL